MTSRSDLSKLFIQWSQARIKVGVCPRLSPVALWADYVNAKLFVFTDKQLLRYTFDVLMQKSTVAYNT